ncbi:MAG: pilus assembly protein TadG-related protein [Actinomycetota bacterium]|nr:pilus assembly protein TadG-related protein [Actinomycetota bacterium]
MRNSGSLARDEGSVLLLAVGMVVVGLLAFTVLINASAAFLQRQRLLALADAAALAGAQALDLEQYYLVGASVGTRLDPVAVAAAVRRHVAASGAAREIDGLVIDRASSDGTSVDVALHAPLRLPFLSDLFDGDVRVESTARLAFVPPA